MNEVTISTNEYATLVSKAAMVKVLIRYIDNADSAFIDTDIIRTIFGVSEPIKDEDTNNETI